MNRAERKSYKQAKDAGWSVLTVGKPDKLLFKFVDDKIHICFREDKGFNDSLSADQCLYLTLLKKVGLDVEVWYEWGDSGFSKPWKINKEQNVLLKKYLRRKR